MTVAYSYQVCQLVVADPHNSKTFVLKVPELLVHVCVHGSQFRSKFRTMYEVHVSASALQVGDTKNYRITYNKTSIFSSYLYGPHLYGLTLLLLPY